MNRNSYLHLETKRAGIFGLVLGSLIGCAPVCLAQENDWGYDHLKNSGSGVDPSRVHNKSDSRDGGSSGRSPERDDSATGMSAKAGSLDWEGKDVKEAKEGADSKNSKENKVSKELKETKDSKDAKAATAGKTPASPPTLPANVDKKALTNLKELLELAAQHKLSPDQVTDLATLLPKVDPTKKAAPPPPQRPGWSNPTTPAMVQGEWLKIASFWPEINKRLQDHQDEAEDFSRLFKALLRLVISSKSLPEEQTNVLLNILGPERIAVEGTPQLTEEAVNGYTDMACFLFELKNPGKTVDADDNRAVFATVIKSKFQEAPSEKAKLAMSNFALTWAKFKIAWDLAPEEKRKELAQHVDDIASGTSYSDTALTKKIFENGPWRKFLFRAPS
jgi:hypothetical protein